MYSVIYRIAIHVSRPFSGGTSNLILCLALSTSASLPSSPLRSSSLTPRSSTITPLAAPSLLGLPLPLQSLLVGLKLLSRSAGMRLCSRLAAVGSTSASATGVAILISSAMAPRSLPRLATLSSLPRHAPGSAAMSLRQQYEARAAISAQDSA